VCLYDFTFKNKNPSYLVFRVDGDLTDYAFDEYFFSEFDHISLQSGEFQPFDYQNIDSREDLLVERTHHLCNLDEYPFFVSNFKTRYCASDPLLISNQLISGVIEDDKNIPLIQ